jgi:hypothetical protein
MKSAQGASRRHRGTAVPSESSHNSVPAYGKGEPLLLCAGNENRLIGHSP